VYDLTASKRYADSGVPGNEAGEIVNGKSISKSAKASKAKTSYEVVAVDLSDFTPEALFAELGVEVAAVA
jgi:hypothetical protein